MKRRILSLVLAGIIVLAALPLAVYAAPVKMVYANNTAELKNAIESNTKIVLSGKTYNIGGASLWLKEVNNLEIIGVPGTKIVCENGDDAVIYVYYSKNIHISNICMGHDIGVDEQCSAGVFKVVTSENVTIDNCDLYGCGISGFRVFDTPLVKFNNSTIRDCTDFIGDVCMSVVEFNGCTFKNNGYAPVWKDSDDAYYWGTGYGSAFLIESDHPNDTQVRFNNCVFSENKNGSFKYESWFHENGESWSTSNDYGERLTRVNNCTFINNAWQSKSTPPPPALTTEGADAWAQTELQRAIDAGILPYNLGSKEWKKPTTRLDAADAMVALIESATGKTIWQLADERGWDLLRNGFDDVGGDYGLVFLKYAGVVTGIGNNKYDPNGTYTRAQAVTMIGRAAEEFFGKTAKGENPFTDVPSWAAPYVGYAAANNITNGVGGGKFNSNGVLQNQETAIFCLRAYTSWSVDN